MAHAKLIGSTPAMVLVNRLIEQVAPFDDHVLILGETGTGKELVAHAVHEKSSRSAHQFVAVNCGNLSRELLEETLFGHERGSFTGAFGLKTGLVEEAGHGTLFLDDIETLELDTQTKLLRLLQEKEFYRVGGHTIIKSHARFVAATNANLKRLVDSRKFRQDLYYRLNVTSIPLPPLRDRVEDIEALASHLLARTCKHDPRHQLSPDIHALLQHYRWPGNVRELENVIRRLDIFSSPGLLDPDVVRTYILQEDSASIDANVRVVLDDELTSAEVADAVRAVPDQQSTDLLPVDVLNTFLQNAHVELKKIVEVVRFIADEIEPFFSRKDRGPAVLADKSNEELDIAVDDVCNRVCQRYGLTRKNESDLLQKAERDTGSLNLRIFSGLLDRTLESWGYKTGMGSDGGELQQYRRRLRRSLLFSSETARFGPTALNTPTEDEDVLLSQIIHAIAKEYEPLLRRGSAVDQGVAT